MKPIDNQGESNSLTVLMALVVIGLLVWQFVLPSYGYSSLSDTLGATEPTPETLTLDYGLYYNSVLQSITQTAGDLDLDQIPASYPCFDIDDESEIPAYTLTVQTNAPSQITNPYKVIVTSTIYEWSGGIETINVFEAEINAFSGTGIKTFNLPFSDEWVTQYLSGYTLITMTLLSPGGLILLADHLAIG